MLKATRPAGDAHGKVDLPVDPNAVRTPLAVETLVLVLAKPRYQSLGLYLHQWDAQLL